MLYLKALVPKVAACEIIVFSDQSIDRDPIDLDVDDDI